MNQRTCKRHVTAYFFCLLALIGMATVADPSQAEDQGPEPERSYFANPAQQQHAQNLADAWAAKHEEEIAKAYAQLTEAKETGDPKAIATAEARLAELEVSVQDIEAMRSQGMGWGQIAHHLNLHPSVLGNGSQAPGKYSAGKNKRIGADGTVNEDAGNSAEHANQGNGKGKDASAGKGSAKGKNK
jgi:hypothetical protein